MEPHGDYLGFNDLNESGSLTRVVCYNAVVVVVKPVCRFILKISLR